MHSCCAESLTLRPSLPSSLLPSLGWTPLTSCVPASSPPSTWTFCKERTSRASTALPSSSPWRGHDETLVRIPSLPPSLPPLPLFPFCSPYCCSGSTSPSERHPYSYASLSSPTPPPSLPPSLPPSPPCRKRHDRGAAAHGDWPTLGVHQPLPRLPQ